MTGIEDRRVLAGGTRSCAGVPLPAVYRSTEADFPMPSPGRADALPRQRASRARSPRSRPGIAARPPSVHVDQK
jgi:hypothetical protein